MLPLIVARHRNPRFLESFLSGHPLTLVEGFPFPHHQKGDLAHRREVPAGSHASVGADDGGHPLVEHRHERLRDLRAAAGEADGVNVGAGQHRGPDHFDGKRLSDPRCVVVNQILLELVLLLRREDDVDQVSDPGVDAVHRDFLFDPPLHHLPAGLDPLQRVVRKLHFLPESRHLDDIIRFEPLALDLNGHRRRTIPKVSEMCDIFGSAVKVSLAAFRRVR